MRPKKASHATSNRKRDAFDQKLTHQLAAASSDSCAHRHFALPCGCSRQQQIGNICTSNQQHKANGSKEDQKSSLEIGADKGVKKGDKADAPVANFRVPLTQVY